MDWTIIAQLIIEVGYPMAMKIWQNATAGGDATQAQWDELQTMANQKAIDRVKLALKAAGIAEDSEQGKLLISLAQ